MSTEQFEDPRPLNVFVHSISGEPDAWTEEEVDVLLGVWRDVLEQFPAKRYDIVRRVLNKLKELDFKRFEEQEKKEAKDEIWKLMDTLRKEYQAFKGLKKVKGLRVDRPPCADILELILDKIPQSRRTRNNSTQQDQVSDQDSDQSFRRHSVSEGEVVSERRRPQGEAGGPKNQNMQPRLQQRRMNLSRLVRVMVNQQMAMLEQLEKLFKVLELNGERMAKIAETSLANATVVQDKA